MSISILRGAGTCFSAGYDLSSNNSSSSLTIRRRGPGNGRAMSSRAGSDLGLAKPVIAQVHGYCLAGGTELATACDVVYVADDAQIGYPPVRLMSPPDMQYHPWLVGMRRAMELMLTGRRDVRPRGRRMGLCDPRVSARRARGSARWISPSARQKSRSNCSSSTSARCIARWRSWARAPRCAPAPKSRRWRSRPKPAAPTCRHSAATAAASRRSSTSAIPTFGDYRTRKT